MIIVTIINLYNKIYMKKKYTYIYIYILAILLVIFIGIVSMSIKEPNLSVVSPPKNFIKTGYVTVTQPGDDHNIPIQFIKGVTYTDIENTISTSNVNYTTCVNNCFLNSTCVGVETDADPTIDLATNPTMSCSLKSRMDILMYDSTKYSTKINR